MFSRSLSVMLLLLLPLLLLLLLLLSADMMYAQLNTKSTQYAVRENNTKPFRSKSSNNCVATLVTAPDTNQNRIETEKETETETVVKWISHKLWAEQGAVLPRSESAVLPMLLPLMLTTIPTHCCSRGVVAVTWSSPASRHRRHRRWSAKECFLNVCQVLGAASAMHSSRLARTRSEALYKAYVIEKRQAMRREPQWATKIEIEYKKRFRRWVIAPVALSILGNGAKLMSFWGSQVAAGWVHEAQTRDLVPTAWLTFKFVTIELCFRPEAEEQEQERKTNKHRPPHNQFDWQAVRLFRYDIKLGDLCGDYVWALAPGGGISS